MFLSTALMKSIHGIATRRRLCKRTSKGREVFEYQIAMCSDKGQIHIFNGRNGSIRKQLQEDQLRSDWEPFQERPVVKSRKLKKVQAEAPAELPPPIVQPKPKLKLRKPEPKKPEPVLEDPPTAVDAGNNIVDESTLGGENAL